MQLRWIIRRDLNEIIPIDNMSSCPWDYDTYLRWLRTYRVIGIVVEADSILAAAVYQLRRDRLTVEHIVVHPEWPSAFNTIVEKLLSQLHIKRRTTLTFVLDDQYELMEVLKSYGFIGHVHKNKIIMTYQLVDHAQSPN